MGVKPSPSDLVTAWLGDDGLSHTGQQRSDHHDASP